MTDEELVQEIQSGNTELFSQIAERYFDAIFRFTMRMHLGRKEEAEDSTAETFYKAYRFIHLYTPQYSFSTWLYRIAKNTVIDSLRKQQRRPSVSLDTFMEEGIDPTRVLPEDKGDSMMVEKFLEYVSEEDRSLLVLYYLEGLSVAEISDLYKIKENTITVKIKRAKEKIRLCLLEKGIKKYE